jgi:hypothetical protein
LPKRCQICSVLTIGQKDRAEQGIKVNKVVPFSSPLDTSLGEALVEAEACAEGVGHYVRSYIRPESEQAQGKQSKVGISHIKVCPLETKGRFGGRYGAR